MNDSKAGSQRLSAMQERLEQTEVAVAALHQELLRLTTEVSRNHSLLVEVAGTVRRSQEIALSFVENQRARELASLVRPVRVAGHDLVRLGSRNDGGYLLLDDWAGVVGLLSGGAGDNVDFEVEVAARGIDVHIYDHTVEVLPCGDVSGITHFLEPLGTTGTSLAAALGREPEGELVLKIDIDGAEWGLLDGLGTELARFRQVVIEIHGLTQLGDSLWFERAARVLRTLRETHAPFHLHANNFGAFVVVGGVPVPDILEVSYARRDSYELVEDASATTRHPLDEPNDPNRPDYALALLD